MTVTVTVCDNCEQQRELIPVVTTTRYDDGEVRIESGEWCQWCLRDDSIAAGRSCSGEGPWRDFVAVTIQDTEGEQ